MKTGFTPGNGWGLGVVRRPRAAGRHGHALARRLRPRRRLRHPGVGRPGQGRGVRADGPARPTSPTPTPPKSAAVFQQTAAVGRRGRGEAVGGERRWEYRGAAAALAVGGRDTRLDERVIASDREFIVGIPHDSRGGAKPQAAELYAFHLNHVPEYAPTVPLSRLRLRTPARARIAHESSGLRIRVPTKWLNAETRRRKGRIRGGRKGRDVAPFPGHSSASPSLCVHFLPPILLGTLIPPHPCPRTHRPSGPTRRPSVGVPNKSGGRRPRSSSRPGRGSQASSKTFWKWTTGAWYLAASFATIS